VEVVAVQGMWLRVKPLAESGRPGASPDALEAPLPEHG
jgi:hypothetical protein